MSEEKQQAIKEKEQGNALYKQHQFDEAIQHYDKAWELDNTDITYLTNKAAVLFEQGKYDDCIKVCEDAVEKGRDMRADYKTIAKAYARIGNAYMKKDDLDNAIKYYNKSLTEHRTPDVLAKLREAEKLKAQREKEAYYDPKLAEEARNAGNELYKKNDWPGAIQQYTESIKRNDKDVRAYSNRSACYLKLLALSEAMKDAEKCIELDPEFARGYTRKAAVEFAKKDYSECLETCMLAKEKDKDGKLSHEIQQQMMKCYAAMNAQGGESQEETLKRAANDPEVQRILGDPVMQQILQQMQQDPMAAQEHLKNPQIAAKIRKLIAAGILKKRKSVWGTLVGAMINESRHDYSDVKNIPFRPPATQTPRLIRSITIDRCNNFTSGGANGNNINLLSQLYRARTDSEEFIKVHVWSVPGLKRVPFEEAVLQEFRPTGLGEWFGPSWSTHWFLIQVTIPVPFAGKEVHFLWNSDNEGLIFGEDGMPLQGLTGGAGSDARHEYILTTNAQGGEKYTFYIEMACNGMFGTGNGLIGPPDPNRFFNLNECELAVPNNEAWALLYDYQVILGIARDLPEDHIRASHALYTANRIVNAFKPGYDKSLVEGRRIAQEFLKQRNGGAQHRVMATGHCHLDTAWLWPFAETIRKAARSWSTQINLMDKYSDYKFTCSQAQQYEWIKRKYPKLWTRILEKAAIGQFCPIGGTWIEMDTNIPSGESLCRQMLLGQRFFEKEFGARSEVLWLPDSFGYSSQLPQIARLAGMKYFFTQKLSWNNINKFPYTTFYWSSLDGSKVLCHMAPSETYNAQGTPEELIRSVRNHRDKEYSNTSLLVFGNGDGGGGPLSSMIERLKRMEDVDGLPKVRMGNVPDFYKSLEDEAHELSTWKGELYFELHRGTYTSQSLIKRYNRKNEYLLRDLETLATLALYTNSKEFIYPQQDLETMWKMLCLCQFHDVVTGSSISMVYDDAIDMMVEIDEIATRLISETADKIWGLSSTTSLLLRQGIMVFNTLPWSRTEVLEIPVNENLGVMPQYSAFGNSGFVLANDALGFATSAYFADQYSAFTPASAVISSNGTFVLENSYLQVVFDKDGSMIGLYDKEAKRQVISAGQRGNVFKIFDDIPLFWDAWDVEIYHLEKFDTVDGGNVRILDHGPLRVSLVVEKKLSETSQLRQQINLNATSRRIDFETEVDWDENRRFLKVEFAWNILADHAFYDTQFGHNQRPTHYNTSWESAKFEVCGHKYADISEFGYGVALMSDSKYGFATHENVMRLSLLRSAKAPDAKSDIGRHVFKYAIYPHNGHFMQADVVRESYNFNIPLLAKIAPEDVLVNVKPVSYFKIEDAPNVILETIKKAEDSNDIILRLYEAYGGHAKARLISSLPVESVQLCNILEEDLSFVPYVTLNPMKNFNDDVYNTLSPMPDEEEGAVIAFDPFQVVTVRLKIGADVVSLDQWDLTL
ncbi:hypothetical protein BZG36_03218 [Bifiguratus adelaidae]|uniref:Alpha-mannosidase n=1 Tax=Bifiguratus adelaidae TaxID=1938954 RepID=A0A261XWX2_9FUNG|nr:hypothetical protein BZG36_03218 [Bifiguratus adelaidae]